MNFSDGLLVDFAHAIAPGPTRAVVRANALVVFVENGPVGDGATVVARVPSPTRPKLVTGVVTYPAPGWVQIGSVAYPEHHVTVRGPVLFVARPVKEKQRRKTR